jgi:hypothetical protein
MTSQLAWDSELAGDQHEKKLHSELVCSRLIQISWDPKAISLGFGYQMSM